MSILTVRRAPKRKDMLLAQESSRKLDRLKIGKTSTFDMSINGSRIQVPVSLLKMVKGALHNLAEGKEVTVVSLDEELSPQQASELLNVSRPYASKLYDKGLIPSRKVGTHRRALTRDVMAYKRKIDAQRHKALDELVAQAQELNMGY